MKKGLILYVIEGRETMPGYDRLDLNRLASRLKVSAVRIAGSEEEIVYGWWELIARGAQEILCGKARFDAAQGAIEPYGTPLRLCG